MYKIFILTLFPDFINTFKSYSIIKRAIQKNKVNIKIIDIRKFSPFKNKQIDDYSYGGGFGMVLMVEPVIKAIDSVRNKNSKVILLSPQGKTLNQDIVLDLNNKLVNLNEELIFICGHYEGFDERIRKFIDLELSIGDYILTGGELASMVICDVIIRSIPGVIKKESFINDSFQQKILDHPVYTKPYDYNGLKVPDVLINGNHKLINLWRRKNALKNTLYKRPDLLKKTILSKEDLSILEELKQEIKKGEKNNEIK